MHNMQDAQIGSMDIYYILCIFNTFVIDYCATMPIRLVASLV
jgi:hypothetical protein